MGAIRLRGRIWWTRVRAHGVVIDQSTRSSNRKTALRILRQRELAIPEIPMNVRRAMETIMAWLHKSRPREIKGVTVRTRTKWKEPR